MSAWVVGVVAGTVLALGVSTAAFAWATARISPALVLGSARGGTGSRFQGWQPLVLAVQGTLCCGLILIGIAAWNQLRERRAYDLGFDPGAVEIAGVDLPEPPYNSQEAVLRFVDGVRDSDRVVRDDLAVATSAPLAGEFIHAWMMRAEGPGLRSRRRDRHQHTPRLLELLLDRRSEVPARRGLPRSGVARSAGSPVVVNQALVEHYWPQDRDPLASGSSPRARPSASSGSSRTSGRRRSTAAWSRWSTCRTL